MQEKQTLEINNFVDVEMFNSLNNEQKQVEGQLYLNNMIGLIQGIAIASEKDKSYKIRTNLNILPNIEQNLNNGILDVIKNKNLVISILEVGSGDGLFLK